MICVAAVAYALASREEPGDPGAANPESAATDYEAALADARGRWPSFTRTAMR